MALTQGVCVTLKKYMLDTWRLDYTHFSCRLVTTSATYSPSSVVFDSKDEIVSQGYTAGGIQLRNVSWKIHSDNYVLSADNVEWSGINTNIAGAVIVYKDYYQDFCFAVLNFVDNNNPNGINPQGNAFKIEFPAPSETTGLIQIHNYN